MLVFNELRKHPKKSLEKMNKNLSRNMLPINNLRLRAGAAGA
jgi:hypothetical protein